MTHPILIGTCTIAIAFLRDIPAWAGKPPGPYPNRYAMSYFSLYEHVKALWNECVVREKRFGWFAPKAGSAYPIGIFIWATGSVEDEDLPDTNSLTAETA